MNGKWMVFSGKNGLYGISNGSTDYENGNISDESIAEYVANMRNIEEEEMEELKKPEVEK